MSDVMSKYIAIATEILIFSILMGLVAVFGSVSRQAINDRHEGIAIQKEIQYTRELSTYLNKGKYVGGSLVDNLVVGEDVLRFVAKFRHEFPITIDLGTSTILLEQYSDTDNKWDIEVLGEILGEYSMDSFTIVSNIDEYSNEVMSVDFIKQ